jgi:hypothetical protein
LLHTSDWKKKENLLFLSWKNVESLRCQRVDMLYDHLEI